MKGKKHKNTSFAAGRRLWLLFMTALLPALLGSCDRVIYDYEGDCSVHYMVQFRYDYNMKWADAFAHEVECVTLYVIDEDGNIVLKQSEEGPALGEEGYEMEIEVDPGRYSLLAWCGTKDNGTFTIPETTQATELTCTLGCEEGDDGPYTDGEVDRLYYGYLADQEFTGTEGTYTYVVPLVKDTNTIQVVLQHTSGDIVDKDKFTFLITSDNRFLDWDNSLMEDGWMTYYAFYTAQAEADFDLSGTKATFSGAVAEFTINRLVQGHETRLTILNNEAEDEEDKVVLSIPVIDYAVMVKGYYNRNMDDQEYLDRQDEYDFVFFLDEGDRWVDSFIYINSWRIVRQNSDL